MDIPPSSAVPMSTSLLGLTGFGLSLAICILLHLAPAIAITLIIALTALPMWWNEWRRFQPSNTIDELLHSPIAIKERRNWYFRGLLTVAPIWLSTLGLFFTCIPDTTTGFWGILSVSWPVWLLMLGINLRKPSVFLSPIEEAGRWWSLRSEPFPWRLLRDQLVKAFFLPLMLAFSYTWFLQVQWNLSEAPSFRWYSLSLALLYLVDTVFASIGYMSASRWLDSHIRSSNPYWLGWISALICYPPFFDWLKATGFNYRDGVEWHHWLGISPPLAWCWGGAILLLTGVYTWATIVFGIRFSNLTHRGIITHGPYRYTKHPAYLAKNASWWLISVPFISAAGTMQATLHCLILVGMNGIYWLRARTEEKHLRSDPVYLAYSTWIAEHGLLARARKMFAFRLSPSS